MSEFSMANYHKKVKSKNKRPIGITIFAILQTLIGLITIIYGVYFLIIDSPFDFSLRSNLIILLSILLLAFGILILFSGFALFRLYPVGRGLILTLAGLNIFRFFLELLIHFELSTLINYIPGLIYAGAIFIYFLRKDIKILFKKPKKNKT